MDRKSPDRHAVDRRETPESVGGRRSVKALAHGAGGATLPGSFILESALPVYDDDQKRLYGDEHEEPDSSDKAPPSCESMYNTFAELLSSGEIHQSPQPAWEVDLRARALAIEYCQKNA